MVEESKEPEFEHVEISYVDDFVIRQPRSIKDILKTRVNVHQVKQKHQRLVDEYARVQQMHLRI